MDGETISSHPQIHASRCIVEMKRGDHKTIQQQHEQQGDINHRLLHDIYSIRLTMMHFTLHPGCAGYLAILSTSH